ncbi:hypothetical protein CsSME_00049047 [Camellia sinensis var. sinensis]
MDAENDVPFLTNGMSHGNGVLEQVPSPIEEDIVLGKVNGVPAIGSDIAGPNGNPENVAKLEDGGTSNSSNEAEPDRITARAESNGLITSKVGGICCVIRVVAHHSLSLSHTHTHTRARAHVHICIYIIFVENGKCK